MIFNISYLAVWLIGDEMLLRFSFQLPPLPSPFAGVVATGVVVVISVSIITGSAFLRIPDSKSKSELMRSNITSLHSSNNSSFSSLSRLLNVNKQNILNEKKQFGKSDQVYRIGTYL